MDNHLTAIIQGCYKLEFTIQKFTIPVGKEIMCPFQMHMTRLFFLQNTVDSVVDKAMPTFFILSTSVQLDKSALHVYDTSWYAYS